MLPIQPICENVLQEKYFSHYERVRRDTALEFTPSNGRAHAPVLSISDDMPEAGGGGASAAASEAPEASSDEDDGGDGDGEDDWRRSSKKHPSPGPAPHSRGTARTGTRNAAKFLPPPADPELTLCRLPQVLTIIPVGRSTWWAGVKSGRFPQPLRLSARCSVWRLSDIRALVASL
ncbi:AlpA family phage regulatory protein [Pulveribacter sp.]|uniref:helix-turn-helix transcriptional regulator n=1 Tax=Pulveribacter sp. TaxID=2678893 RepID=UPI0028AE3D41|nr:AlpA family phage regulatory protein [Pulveribacter sp.]